MTYVIIRAVHWRKDLDHGCRLSPLIFITKLMLLKLISQTYNPEGHTRVKFFELQRGMSFEINLHFLTEL